MITVVNLTKTPVDKKLLTGVANIVLKGENILRNKNLSVVFLNAGKIKELNKKYRQKNKPTDVLSFENDDGLGEVVICPDAVKKNAEENGKSFKQELSFVLIHGILHLLGYDHPDEVEDPRLINVNRDETIKDAGKMQAKEKYYLSLIK